MQPPQADAVPAGVKSLLDAGRERLAAEREAVRRQREKEAENQKRQDLPAAKAMRGVVIQLYCPAECWEYVQPAENVVVRRTKTNILDDAAGDNPGRRLGRVLVLIPGLAPIGVQCEEDEIGSMRFRASGDAPIQIGQPKWMGADRGVEFEFIQSPRVSDFGRALALAEETAAAARAMFERQKDVPF